MIAKAMIEIHLKKIELLLIKSISYKNPAMWLFQNDLRTPMFMLEAFFRVYENVYDSKDFKKRKKQCKQVEDILGAIDSYSVAIKELSVNKKIPPTTINYLKQQASLKIDEFNKILIDQKWLSGNRIDKIRKNIQKNNWLEDEKEIKQIQAFYLKSINKVKEFVGQTTFVFNNIEEDVHELRRRLRWLSIYPQALSGLFEYANNDLKPDTNLKKYLTTNIVQSAYNVLPTDLETKRKIKLNKNNFLALSWMIKELGNIKDEGLRVLVTMEALEFTTQLKLGSLEMESYKLLSKSQSTLKQLLIQSQAIVKTYFKEDSISKLME